MTSADGREVDLARLRPFIARARGFSGWDLSAAPAHLLEPGPSWDYAALARAYGVRATSVLDLGTGGGEVLAGLRPDLPARVAATEEWHVNVPVAYRRLTPLGVCVVWCSWPALPFADATFDLVLDRHEALEPTEVARVLRPGGYVLTQQVNGENWRELRAHFPRKLDYSHIYDEYAAGFEAAGLTVTRQHHQYRVAYRSLGDVVYLLALMPWLIPDFDLERDLDALLALEADCATDQGIVLTESRFLITAAKLATS